MKIICKTTLLAPAPPFVGTRIGIKLDDPASLTWGIGKFTLADGHGSATISWGDGSQEQVTGGELTHTYPRPGEYEVRITDDIKDICCLYSASTEKTTFIEMVREFSTNATALATISGTCLAGAANLKTLKCEGSWVKSMLGRAFANCSSVIGRVDFLGAVTLGPNTFTGCTGITEIHFAEANEAAIKAQSSWESSHHTFGAPNAVISFDL